MSLLTVLWIIWGAVTLCFIAVMVWKAMASLHEEHDIVILDENEKAQEAEVQQTIAKMERLTTWAKRFGFASLGLLVVTGAIWIYGAVRAVATGQVPQ